MDTMLLTQTSWIPQKIFLPFRRKVTTDDLITALKNMNVADIHDIEYMALYDESQMLDALTQMTLLPLDRLHYRPKELNSMIKKFLK